MDIDKIIDIVRKQKTRTWGASLRLIGGDYASKKKTDDEDR